MHKKFPSFFFLSFKRSISLQQSSAPSVVITQVGNSCVKTLEKSKLKASKPEILLICNYMFTFEE